MTEPTLDISWDNGDVCCALCERFAERVTSRLCHAEQREVVGLTDARNCPSYSGPDGHRALRHDWPDSNIRARIWVGAHILWADCHGSWAITHGSDPMLKVAGGDVARVAGVPTNWTVFKHAKLAAEEMHAELLASEQQQDKPS